MKALINPQPPTGDEEKVAGIMKHIEENMGFVPDGLRMLGVSPILLENMMGNVAYFMAHEELSQDLLWTIRYLNSEEVSCNFCISFTEGMLMNNLGKTANELQAAKQDPNDAPLTDNEKILLKIALASCENPENITGDDLQKACNAGYSERNIFDAVAVAINNRAFTHFLRTFKIDELQGSFV
jgi:alkylhydroperoxidase/carboxymuconolactone decarboxylase family protein YurZ